MPLMSSTARMVRPSPEVDTTTPSVHATGVTVSRPKSSPPSTWNTTAQQPRGLVLFVALFMSDTLGRWCRRSHAGTGARSAVRASSPITPSADVVAPPRRVRVRWAVAQPAGRRRVVDGNPGPVDRLDGVAASAALVVGGVGVGVPVGAPAAGVGGEVEPVELFADRLEGD